MQSYDWKTRVHQFNSFADDSQTPSERYGKSFGGLVNGFWHPIGSAWMRDIGQLSSADMEYFPEAVLREVTKAAELGLIDGNFKKVFRDEHTFNVFLEHLAAYRWRLCDRIIIALVQLHWTCLEPFDDNWSAMTIAQEMESEGWR